MMLVRSDSTMIFIQLTSSHRFCILIHDRGVEPAKKMAGFVTQKKRHSTIGCWHRGKENT